MLRSLHDAVPMGESPQLATQVIIPFSNPSDDLIEHARLCSRKVSRSNDPVQTLVSPYADCDVYAGRRASIGLKSSRSFAVRDAKCPNPVAGQRFCRRGL